MRRFYPTEHRKSGPRIKHSEFDEYVSLQVVKRKPQEERKLTLVDKLRAKLEKRKVQNHG